MSFARHTVEGILALNGRGSASPVKSVGGCFLTAEYIKNQPIPTLKLVACISLVRGTVYFRFSLLDGAVFPRGNFF